MLKRNFLTLVIAVGLFLSALNTNCAARTVYVVKAPPAPKVIVVKTPAPHINDAWVNGYWRWHGGRYVWVNGYWVKPRRGHIWIQGHWAKRPRGWIWVEGYWRRVR